MKSFATSFVLSILTVLLSFNYASAGVAGQVLDQQNSNLPWIDCSQISDMNRAQIFKPSINRITAVELYLAARAVGANITLTIVKKSDSSTVGEITQELTAPIDETWETFSFSEPYVMVVPEETYSLNLISTEDQTRICYTGNNYARGFYRTLPDVDWLFTTHGISVADAAAPAATNSPNASTSSNSSSSRTSRRSTTTAPATSNTTPTPATVTEKNIAQVDTTPIAPVPWYRNILLWILSGIELLALAFFLFLIIRRRQSKSKIKHSLSASK